MLILLLFSFIAGVVTILSPCILPILPIVLSGSLSGGKKRPIGIVIGFIVSFTFFTLFLTAIVRLLGIPADALRLVSIILIGVFGISLLLPGFQEIAEKLFARLSVLVPQSQSRTGLTGGFLIGLSIGLLWTPCVGPILASVISLALTGSVSSSAFLITFAYSLGTAIPMLAIIYGGRSLLNKTPWLTRNTVIIQKIFGVVMILMAIAIFFNLDRKFQTYILDKFPGYGAGLTSIEDNRIIKNELESLGGDASNVDMGESLDKVVNEMNKAPELILTGEWFNSEPFTLAEQRGKVVLVDFWTYTCINCIRTLPYLKNWHEAYKDEGLVIVGVHTPEFEFEKDADNLQEAINDFDLKYAVMQDNDYKTWRAYNNSYWPAKYLIDKDGVIRYTHFGEGAYDETEMKIQELLAESGNKISQEINNPDYQVETRTPELYLGYSRMQYFASGNLARGNTKNYQYPASLAKNRFAYEGDFVINEEYSAPVAGSKLKLNFESKNVFLVMRTTDGQKATAKLTLDGKELVEGVSGGDVLGSSVEVSTNRLYELISLPSSGEHILEIEFLDDNIEIYAFTFG